jgi:hypothetical protein
LIVKAGANNVKERLLEMAYKPLVKNFLAEILLLIGGLTKSALN